MDYSVDSLPGRLIRHRLRYYFTATTALLRRQWQWLLLIYGIGELIIDLRAFADPLLAVTLDASPPYHAAAALCLFHTLGVFWARAQRDAILGGPMIGYLNTLPIPTSVHTACNVLLLIIGNNVLWVLLVPTLLFAPWAEMSVLQKALLATNVAIVSTTLLVAQRCMLERRIALLPVLAAVDLLVVANVVLSGPWRLAAACTVLIVMLALLAFPPAGIHTAGRTLWRRRSTSVARSRRLVPIALVLRMKAVLDARTPALARLMLAIGLATFASAANAYTDEPQSAPGIWLVTNGLIAATLAGLYEILRRAHHNARAFTASLPLPGYEWIVQDVVAIALLSLVIVVPPIFALWCAGRLLGGDALFVLAAHSGLIVLYRPFLAWVRPHVVAGSLVLVITWTGLALYTLSWTSAS